MVDNAIPLKTGLQDFVLMLSFLGLSLSLSFFLHLSPVDSDQSNLLANSTGRSLIRRFRRIQVRTTNTQRIQTIHIIAYQLVVACFRCAFET